MISHLRNLFLWFQHLNHHFYLRQQPFPLQTPRDISFRLPILIPVSPSFTHISVPFCARCPISITQKDVTIAHLLAESIIPHASLCLFPPLPLTTYLRAANTLTLTWPTNTPYPYQLGNCFPLLLFLYPTPARSAHARVRHPPLDDIYTYIPSITTNQNLPSSLSG